MPKHIIRKGKRNKAILTSLVFIIVLLIPLQHYKTHFSTFLGTLKESNQLRKLKKQSLWEITKSSPSYDTYVLVIGKGARKDYHGAYGYPINNTPFMSNTDGILVDGFVSSGTTDDSLSLLLTYPDKSNSLPRHELNLISLANDAGFETSWLSNQSRLGKSETPITAIADRSSKKIFIKQKKSSSKNTDDLNLLPIFNKILFQPHKKPRLIVLHLQGSYPEPCERLHNFKNNHLTSTPFYAEISCYLASIEKADSFLWSVKKDLDLYANTENKKYSMIYISDHGLSHSRESDRMTLKNINTKQQYEIPLFKTSSDDNRRQTIKKYSSGLNFTNGLSSWMGIESSQLNNSYNLFSATPDDNDHSHKAKLSSLPDDPEIDITPHLIDKKQATIKANSFIKDKNRLIAHAGGSVDGLIYLNSLESLNKSYSLGFRLFELDIIETRDGYYVASHRWKDWVKQTNYKGRTPPTLKEFKSRKLYGKYTPLDLDDINKWFTEHPDAILVSDKVNKPQHFSSQFIDPSRLQMELFSWPAIQEALDIGLPNPMATLGLINKLPSNIDKIQHLKKLGIKHVVANRNMDKVLAKKMKDSGIKIYAFILGNSIREEETICMENQYFYGIYADSFDFDNKIDCKKY